MQTTLSSKWRLPVAFLLTFYLAACGVTTKKTFLGEPVQKDRGPGVPVSTPAGQTSAGELVHNPALNVAEATGVQKLLNIITPYRVDIQQGNFVSREMLEKIQQGMTKEQIRFALGTPLLTDIFHANRWDYSFRLQKPNGHVTNNRVVIFFEDNRVSRIIHDPLPGETEYLETISGPAPKKKVKETPKEDAAKTVSETPPAEDVTPAAETMSVTREEDAADTPHSTARETETETAVPVHTGPVQTPPVETRSYEDARQSAESYRAGPATAEPAESHAETTGSYRQEPVHEAPAVTETRETVPAAAAPVTAAEPVRSTPQPAKAARTVTRDVDAPEEDFRAAPNSTMQLHELMQPQ